MTDSMLPLLASSTEAGTIGIATDAIVRWLLDHGQGLFDAVNALILGMAAVSYTHLTLPTTPYV